VAVIHGNGNTLSNRITGNAGNNSLFGFGGRDVLLGDAGGDTLDGGDLEDSLVGGSGNDSLQGGFGSDILNGTDVAARGANERDTLTGGAGGDLFVFGDGANAFYDTALNDGDYAVIADFSMNDGDQLQLRNLFAGPSSSVNGYVFGGPIYGAIGSANSYLYRDTDNSGAANAGDNLIAAIQAAGGGLQTSDLQRIGIFV